MLIEIRTFSLLPGTDEADFLAADRGVQEEVVATAVGFVRRTTARGADGEWIVIQLWRSEADALASSESTRAHPALVRFMSLLDAATVRRSQWQTLD